MAVPAAVVVALAWLEVAETVLNVIQGVHEVAGYFMKPKNTLNRQLVRMEQNIINEIRSVQLEDHLETLQSASTDWYDRILPRIPDGVITARDFELTGVLYSVAPDLDEHITQVLAVIGFFQYHRLRFPQQYLQWLIEAYTLAITMIAVDEAFQTARTGAVSHSVGRVAKVAGEARASVDAWAASYKAQRVAEMGLGARFPTAAPGDQGFRRGPRIGSGGRSPERVPTPEREPITNDFQFSDKGGDNILGSFSGQVLAVKEPNFGGRPFQLVSDLRAGSRLVDNVWATSDMGGLTVEAAKRMWLSLEQQANQLSNVATV